MPDDPATGDPVADAGPDQTVVLPNASVTLHGRGTIVAYQWSQVSGSNVAAL